MIKVTYQYSEAEAELIFKELICPDCGTITDDGKLCPECLAAEKEYMQIQEGEAIYQETGKR